MKRTLGQRVRLHIPAGPGALLLVPYGSPPVLTTVQGVCVGGPDKREIGLKATFEF